MLPEDMASRTEMDAEFLANLSAATPMMEATEES